MGASREKFIVMEGAAFLKAWSKKFDHRPVDQASERNHNKSYAP